MESVKEKIEEGVALTPSIKKGHPPKREQQDAKTITDTYVDYVVDYYMAAV